MTWPVSISTRRTPSPGAEAGGRASSPTTLPPFQPGPPMASSLPAPAASKRSQPWCRPVCAGPAGSCVSIRPARSPTWSRRSAARAAARSPSSTRAIPNSASTCSTGSAQAGRRPRRTWPPSWAGSRPRARIMSETAASSSSRQSSFSPAFLAISSSPEYEGKRTLKALHEFMAQPEASFRKRLAHIHKASTNKFVRDALGPFINLTEDTFSGVFKGATNEIDWLKYDPYAGLVSGSNFKAQDILTGQMDVFISIDLGTLQKHPGIGRVIIGALLNTVYKAEGAVADRVLFLVDEARMLGTMSLLETVRDAMRKYGITLVLVYQSVGQLDEIWGRYARSKWFDNVDWMSFAAVGHLETAEFIAKKCGTYTVETVSRTLSSAGRSSRTRSYASRDLIMPQEVMQDMRADEQIVFVRGQRPIRCGRAIFFRRKEMKALVGVSRFQAKPDAPGGP